MRVEHADDWQHRRQLFSPYMQSMLGFVDRKSAIDMIIAERQLDSAKVYAQSLLAEADMLLLPTAPQRAFSFDDEPPANQADLTSLANQAGLPAVSLPMFTNQSLPAGMQLVGTSGSDFVILNVAEQWQRHSGFKYQIPS
jgi:aspartyl-tRNA(Asn)/glutamyl-tRNA(Gln) amidotransferase subunit A